MLPWSKAVCCIVVSVGQGDEGIAWHTGPVKAATPHVRRALSLDP